MPSLIDNDADWATLAVDDALAVVKLAPDGSEVVRYPGTVIRRHEPGTWVVVQAVWTYRELDVAGLTFAPGDVLAEWFSPRHDFNAFAVHTASGAFRGWYANVTHPARLDIGSVPPTLAWHDLYIDVIALPDGAMTVCDEDELAASGLMHSDPCLYKRIQRARAEILGRVERQEAPFVGGPYPAS